MALRVVLALLVAAALVPLVHGTSGAQTATISVDGAADGGEFHGFGGLSAGASSRLFIDYPEPQRGEILDYLFTPNYGASMDILDVEVGGDTLSTGGSEPSHARTSDDLDCDRGYEWWLMAEAKERNPHIILAARQWGAPAWVGGSLYTDANIEFLISWLECARDHGLEIDYMAGWNERSAAGSTRAAWYKNFRSALDENDFDDVGLVIGQEDGNGSWASAGLLANDPELLEAVDALAGHYPCRGAPRGTSCQSGQNFGPNSVARQLGIPLWAGEMGSDPYDTGAPNLARALNRQYIDGSLTMAVHWSAIAAWHPTLPADFSRRGIMLAERPWSGHYEAERSLWTMAHTTQFVDVGWNYVRDASGLEPLTGGSYVTLRSPDGQEFSTVIETTIANEPQELTLEGIEAQTVQLWSTDLASSDPDTWFVQHDPVAVENNEATVTLLPDHVYTVTSTTGQRKGDAEPPEDHPWPLPYREDFEGYPTGATPTYISDLEGTWETAPCDPAPPSGDGTCLIQVITDQPVRWRPEPLEPATVIGDPGWDGDYTVGVDVLLDEPDTYVEVAGRMEAFDFRGTGLQGYHLRLYSSGEWELFRQPAGSFGNINNIILSSGEIDLDGASWHRLQIAFDGTTITPSINGDAVGEPVTNTVHSSGQAVVQIDSYRQAQMDNFTVCPKPDDRETVIVGGIDTGVAERVTPEGCALNDLIRDEDEWPNHGAFVRHVSDVTTELVERGVISGREKGAIVRAAAQTRPTFS